VVPSQLAMAVRCSGNRPAAVRRRAKQHLNEFWGLEPDLNELRAANRFVNPDDRSEL
jgi:hypothetical protein